MRLVSRSGMLATTLAIGALAAPHAHAGGLLSGSTPDPPGAAQQEAQSFLRIYSHSAATPAVATPDRAAVARDKASIGAAFERIAQVNSPNIASTATPVVSSASGGFHHGDAAIGALAAPHAQAGGLLSGSTPDSPGAAQQEAQGFLRIYSHSAATPTAATPDRAAVARDKASIGAAFERIAQVNSPNIASTATPVVSSASGGFHYGDAAIGAGAMAGLALLGIAGTLAVRRRSQLLHR